MTDQTAGSSASEPNQSSIFYDPKIRGYVYQAITAVIFIYLVYTITQNTLRNMPQSTSPGFGFLNGRAGFSIGQSLLEYSSDSTYWRALFVGFLNTLQVALLGIVTATIVGFIVGIARLSNNWLIRKIATVYVEVFRNIPPLLVIFFWYKGVLSVLPQPRDSVALPLASFLNNRGLFFPKPIFAPGIYVVLAAILLAVIATMLIARWAHRRQAATGQQFHTIWTGLGLIIGLPLIAFFASGMPITFDYPVAGKFNLTGGSIIGPEFISLYLALSFYTAAFIAEIVRSGIRGVPKGQTEAASALGLQPASTTRLVVVPQALRIIIPPLASQYLNLTKNSSLAVAVGFADLVSVGNTILNQSGQAVKIVAIWMIVYLTLSILTSLLMNWFNNKMALVER